MLKQDRAERKAVAARASLEIEALRQRYVRYGTAVSLSIVAQISYSLSRDRPRVLRVLAQYKRRVSGTA